MSSFRLIATLYCIAIEYGHLRTLNFCNASSTFMPFWAGNLRYKAEILPIRRKTLNDQSDNQSLHSRYTTRDVVLHVLSEGTSRLVAPLQQTRRNSEWKKYGKFTDWWQTKDNQKDYYNLNYGVFLAEECTVFSNNNYSYCWSRCGGVVN